jgi:alpha-beta hydrolase superfamily lysophospholipase
MDFPVGYLDFHSDDIINFQINRWYSLGYCREEDLRRAGEAIAGFDDYPVVFTECAEEAERDRRLKNAAFYYRAAEFLTLPDDDRKAALYTSFRQTFERAFREASYDRYTVPYADGQLPVLHVEPEEPAKGTIVAHGGLDSFIECWYGLWRHFADRGYEVYAFEGPGQGAAHRTYGLTFEHDWENPTGAILDFFDLEGVSLLGFSFGGYWCLRAAAFDDRIDRVIAAPPLFDLLKSEGAFSQWMARLMMRSEGLMKAAIRLQMKLSPVANFYMQHILSTIDRTSPYGAAEWVLEMNEDHLRSDRITQDVLLTAGENDAFQPPELLRLQADALTHARSVTTRVFTEEEQADQHCQVGNLGLALDVMTKWLDAHAADPAAERIRS